MLDASAVLAVVESAVLATMVDRILFIVQWNRTPRASVIEAFRSLFIFGWDATALWRGVAVCVGLMLVGLLLVHTGLDRRLQRT